MASGVLIAAIAGFTPIGEVAELVNIGTLAAFVLVCAGVIHLRYTRPDLKRPFRTPFGSVTPLLGIIFCLYLMFSLPPVTWMRFGIWLILGAVIYFTYSRSHSSLNRRA
jgi:APA family basic amino acid/polyamine antiporter